MLVASSTANQGSDRCVNRGAGERVTMGSRGMTPAHWPAQLQQLPRAAEATGAWQLPPTAREAATSSTKLPTAPSD